MRRLLLIIIAALLFIPSSCAYARNTNGTWVSKSDGFTAQISNNTITIKYSDTKDLYWKGTFSSKIVKKIVSKGDVVAMNKSLFASGDATKKFTYKNSTLSFTFGALGKTTTVHLKRK